MVKNRHSLFRAMILLPLLGGMSAGYAAQKSEKLVGAIEQDLFKAVDLLGRQQQLTNQNQQANRINLKDLEGLDLKKFIQPAKPRQPKAAQTANTRAPVSYNIYRQLMASTPPRTSSRSRYRPCYKFNYHELQNRARRYEKSIREASRMHRVSENLIKSVITAESCFKVRARSHKGARGLMQLMPATARRFGVRNSYDSHQNIRAGTEYLRWLLDRFKGNVHLALAGYNAGEGKVDRYGGIPPYKETREYVRRVMGVYKTLHGKSSRSYNESRHQGFHKTRADYQQAWRQQQRIRRNQNQHGRSLNNRRCVEALPRHISRITSLKRSGHGGRIWRRYYQLRAHENLTHVMRKTGVHINAIKRMNHLNSRSNLNAGHKLLVWECRA